MTIAEICQLSDEVRTGELLISVFIDRAIKDPASKEADRGFVLRATYPTAPLRSLAEHVAQKLSGRHPKGSAVIRGTYGSGKSHALLALYHLVAAGEEAWPVLEKWGVQAIPPPTARVALVQLRAENPLTLWELLFERAGRPDLNAQVREYPTRQDWAALGREKPTLLIVDELEDWFAAQEEWEQARTRAALANLLEAAELSDAALAVALAVYGTNDELMTIINRLQPPVWDVGTAEDRQKIVRHRLIDRLDEAKAREVVRSYIETYENVRSELPGLVNLGDLRQEMEVAYPFHPFFLRQAYQVYAAMPRHESTRGVVGVCATLLRRLAWQRDLILTGDLDVTDEEIASDLRKLDPELVANTVEDLRERCAAVGGASGILGTILLHSFSPVGIPGATEEQVLLGNLRPKVNINDLRRALDEVRQQKWFVDEVNDRLVVSKEVVLVKQIEQMARARLETVEGQAQAAEHLRNLIRQAVGGEHLTLYPEEPLPTPLTSAALKTVVSLEPVSDSQALDLLREQDNTVVLIAPRPAVRGRLTQDREFLLRVLLVLVCEELLKQQTKRQAEVRRLRQQYVGQISDLPYGQWMRLSRLNELGEEPKFIIRPEPCTLSAEAIRQAIQKVYDVDSVREGLARLLRHQGRLGQASRLPHGSEQAGLTVHQLHDGLRRYPGLPMVVDGQRLEQALRAMVADASPDSGAVVQVGKALYGYESTALASIISPDWRVWLKKHGPEPPARADVKQRARQELAQARGDGIEVRGLKRAVTEAIGMATAEAARALAELVNEGEAVPEQGSARYPDDGLLASEVVQDSGWAWLAEYAPPDARRAEQRILEILAQAGDSGMSFAQVKTQLELEGLEERAIQRAMKRLRVAGKVGVYTSDGQTLLGEAIPDECLLRLPRIYPPPPPPGVRPFEIPVGPYRLLDQLLSDLRSRLQEKAQIREAIISIKPFEAPDPLFGRDEEAQRIAQESIEHRLIWRFKSPITREALVRLVQGLRERLKEGQVTAEMTVKGEVPGHDAG
jgi:hypothetical protein